MTVTGIALICVGLVLLVAFRAVLFGGRKRKQARAAREVAANRRAQLPAAPADDPWAADLPPASADGPWAADLPPASADGPWAAEQSAEEPWDASGGHPGRPVRRGSARRPRTADDAVPATGGRIDAAAGRVPARRSRGNGTAAGRTRPRAGGFGDDRIDGPDPGYADGADPRYADGADPRYADGADPRYADGAGQGYADGTGSGYADDVEPGYPAKAGVRRGARGERRTVWLDPDPEAGPVVRSVPVVAGAAETASGPAASDEGAADDIVDEPGSRRFRRRKGTTGAVQRRRRREEDEDSPYVLASLGLADEDPSDGDDLFEAPDQGARLSDGERADVYGGAGEPRPTGPSGSGEFGDPDDPHGSGDFSGTAFTGPGAAADADEPAGPDGPADPGLVASGLAGSGSSGSGSSGSGLSGSGMAGSGMGGSGMGGSGMGGSGLAGSGLASSGMDDEGSPGSMMVGRSVDGGGSGGTGGSGAAAGSGGISATLFDDDLADEGMRSSAGVGLDRGEFARSEFDRPGNPGDPEPLSPYRAAAPAPRGWPADRSDQRYGDRVEGWVRPQYREMPVADTAGAYWTPAPDGPYVEPSANGYGWPVPVERLPAAPPYEPVTGFDEPPVSDLTTVVPSWPPIGETTNQPRFAPARDSGAGILWGSARDDTVWGDSGADGTSDPHGWPPAGPGRRSPGPLGDPVDDRVDGRVRDQGSAPRFGGAARRPGPPRGSVPVPGSLPGPGSQRGSGSLPGSGSQRGSGSLPGSGSQRGSGSSPMTGFGRPRELGAPSGPGVAPMQGLGPARGFGRAAGLGRPSGYAPAQGVRPEAVPLPADDPGLRARPRPRPRPRPGGAESRSTVYVSRHAADPG
ncbi:hypothetical protein KRMM14A1004_05820 [Krasilnikovia sp. MM14-A1004]